MLKSTLNAAKPSEPKRPTLPHLFRSVVHGHVVIFFSEVSGTEIVRGNINREFHHSNCWVSCWNTAIWTPLKPGESVTITVEED